jgi:hypothetical protein
MSIHTPGPALIPCPNCGETMNEDDLYCRFCGKPMVSTGFDDDGNVVVRSQTSRSGGGLRGVGEQSRLADPHERRSKREGTLARVGGGPIGCTGLLAIVLGILVLVMLVAWFLVRPAIADSARDGVEEGISRELALHSISAETTTLTINEITINEYVDASDAWFDPVSDLRIDLRDNEVVASFTLYGASGTFSSGVTVQDGVIRLVNPETGGAGGRLIDGDEIARVIEQQLRIFVQNEARPITNVSVDDGEITIVVGN